MMAAMKLGQIAELVNGELRGDPQLPISGAAPISRVGNSQLTWLTDPAYREQVQKSPAAAVLVRRELADLTKPMIICTDVEMALSRLLNAWAPPLPHPPVGIDSRAVIGTQVELGEDVAIGPNVVIQNGASIGARTIIHAGCFIGEQSVIGDDGLLWPNVVIRERTQIGQRVIIHPNAVIGADGFGYLMQNGEFKKIPHIGRVRIEDDVEIGAGSCIDRAKCDETVIGRGTKIDNLVQIGHNVHVGPHCCLIAQVGIAGSTELGHHVMLAGKVGLKDNIRIGNGVQVAACSCVSANVNDGEIMLGVPAQSKSSYFRERATINRYSRLWDQVRELMNRVEQLEAANHSKTC
ncbi:MAG: UDP-3-O-acylglucosamine N-acyltransferase [Phycisphaerae bacterium]|nr:UDP-3-O-acylglucosamine N-acyltransferase [Phycisphaerae bacterium]